METKHEHETIIKIENLETGYPSLENPKKITTVLKDINLEINATDFVIIYGPSGSGKSTLLHNIVGLEVPTKGDITIRGTKINRLSAEERAIFRAKKFGMVYQMPYWIRSLSIWENVAMPLLISGYSSNDAKTKAFEVLKKIDFEKYAEKRPMQLSGGEQQKLSLARALVNNPWIIIADEPTGNLDTHSSDQVTAILQELKVKYKRTIIMVTHNLIYLPLANKKVAIRDGKIVSEGNEAVKSEIKKELAAVL